MLRCRAALGLVLMSWASSSVPAGGTLEFAASETLTALEMNHGQTLRFTLRNGQTRTLTLRDTSVQILEKNRGGIVYMFECQVRVDGHDLTLRRYVGTQESFYEPYVINGMRIWPDFVAAVYEKVPMRYPATGNLRRRPRRHARFAVQDATLPICPQEMKPWYPNDTHVIDVGDCYNGDDCYMGAYLGQACHGGLDINHERDEAQWAPIDFDDQWNFNSLKAGHNNNRWRGVRRWDTGDVWALQSHHHLRLLVPEHTPIRAGAHYAEAAGVHIGSHAHTHFEFKIAPQVGDKAIDFDDTENEPRADGQPEVIHLDPWILFWQIFETSREKEGRPLAAISPLSPVKTGTVVAFQPGDLICRADGSRPPCYWTFGDGGWSDNACPEHTYARPGLYAVTLTIDDHGRRDQTTQLVTVEGEAVKRPALALFAPDEPSFRRRAVTTLDVYGAAPRFIAHTLTFLARPSRPKPDVKVIQVQNVGGGTLPPATVQIVDRDASDWLDADIHGSGNQQKVSVAVDAENWTPGLYEALVEVNCPAALNSPQRFRVVLVIPATPPQTSVIVDDRAAGCYCTPYFWVGHKFCRCENRGFGQFYLSNGSRPAAGEFVRFTPDLVAGKYRVSLRAETPFRNGSRFSIRVHGARGDESVMIDPTESPVVGEFNFNEGTDGFVEIHAEGSTGLVMADAFEFVRVGD